MYDSHFDVFTKHSDQNWHELDVVLSFTGTCVYLSVVKITII
jgi:hypothetical protein